MTVWLHVTVMVVVKHEQMADGLASPVGQCDPSSAWKQWRSRGWTVMRWAGREGVRWPVNMMDA